jgi:recombinational DNA repair protein (RecF pathway)
VLFLAFEVKLLGALGALPEFGTCASCGSSIRNGRYDPANGVSYCSRERTGSGELITLNEEITGLIHRAERLPFFELAPLEMSDRARKTFGLLLHWTYTYHVQGYRLPNSLKLLK